MEDSRREIIVYNQIITIDKIIEISDYLKGIVKHYNDLAEEDERNNKDKDRDQKVYNYSVYSKNYLEYTIEFLDGRRIKTQEEYDFKEDLKEPQNIKAIDIHVAIHYYENHTGEKRDHTISVFMALWKDHADIYTTSKLTDEETYNINNYIRGICEKGEERYSPIIKNRFLIKNMYAFSVGAIISYIPILLMFVLKNSETSSLDFIFNSNIIFLIIHWFIIFILGIFFGYPIISNLYRGVEPEKNVTFSSAELNRQQDRDITERYINGNEVLIGDKANNLQKRDTIRKYYDFSKKVLLIQLGISIIIFIIMSFTSNTPY